MNPSRTPAWPGSERRRRAPDSTSSTARTRSSNARRRAAARTRTSTATTRSRTTSRTSRSIPANPNHMIASSNDYGSCCDQFYTTFNDGATWTTGNMSRNSPQVTGSDPVTVFDLKHGTAIHSSLNYSSRLRRGEACRRRRHRLPLDRTAASPGSRRGRRLRARLRPVEHAALQRQGVDRHRQQPRLAAYGRTYLTWTKFLAQAAVQSRRRSSSRTRDDGGKHWTKAQEISGSNAELCTFQVDGPSRPVRRGPVLGADGGPGRDRLRRLPEQQNESLWETGEVFDDQYLLVKSTDGGQHWSSPTFVVGLEDGSRDYPLNVDGRQTLTGYQVRVNSAGNIVASPRLRTASSTSSSRDNRNGIHDSANPVTNTDVFLMSLDERRQQLVRADARRFESERPVVPVGRRNPTNGTIGVLYHDRGVSNRRSTTRR